MSETVPQPESELEKATDVSVHHVEGVNEEEDEFHFTSGKFFAILVGALFNSPYCPLRILWNVRLMSIGSNPRLPCNRLQYTDDFAYPDNNQR